MAETLAPPAPAPAAAPSTPAAAPAPAAPSTPAPATPAPATPATPAEPQSTSERLAAGWEKAKAAVPLETEEVLEPAPEVPAVEAAPPEVQPEQPPEGEAEPKAEGAEVETPEWLLDDGEAYAPDAFAKELNTDPAAKKFFDERPDLKGKVFGALRRDAENREIRSYIPDVETAKVVTQAAASFQNIDNHFLNATTPEGAKGFLDHWVREAMYVDDKGQPIRDENGKLKIHPALPFILDHIAGNKVSYWANELKATGRLPAQMSSIIDALKSFATTKGDERLQAVADVLREVISPSSPGSEAIPDELKPFADSLKAKETALDKREQDAARQRQEQQQVAHFQSIERAESKAADSVQALLKPRFAASGLTEFEQDAAFREIGEVLDRSLGHMEKDGSWFAGTHPSAGMFQSIYDSILRNFEPGEEREKALNKHLLTYTQPLLGKITAEVIRQAKKGALERQTAKQTTVDSQKRDSKTEPQGVSITPSGPQNLSPAQMRTQVVKDLTTQLGRDPDTAEVMKEMWKRTNAPKR